MSLLTKASLVMTPNAIKSNKVYSIIPSNGNGDLTFTRDTSATQINSLGNVENVLTTIPRLNYDAVGGCPSLLLEPQRTNLVLRSEEFSNVNWEKGTPITLVSNTTETTSPQGINNATKATANGTGLIHIRQSVFGATTSPTTNSIFVKKANNRYVGFRNGGSGTLHDVFDFNTETWTNNSGSTLSFDKLTNGWYRLKSSRTNTLPNTYISVTIPDNTSGNETATVSNLTLYLWGGQSELNVLYPTSYIPTTTTALTRNADVITRNNIYTNGLITSAGGTWFLEVINNLVYIRDSPSSGIYLDTNNASFTSGFNIRTEPTNRRLSISKWSPGSVLYTTLADIVKIAIKWNGVTADVFVNGTKEVSATAFTTTAMQFLGGRAEDCPKNIKQIALWATPLTDAECIALTQ